MQYPTLQEVVQQAEIKQHPFGQVWQPFDEETFNELVRNIDSRGLDKPIIRYKGMIVEGYHRYLACLATNVNPIFTEFKGTDLEAAELVHASGIRRQSSADQRYAAFDQLCEACPEFREKYEKLRAKADEQQRQGKPLATGGQRVDVLKAKAEAAGVSKSTAKKIEQVKKANPKAVVEIAAGKTTANREVKKLKGNLVALKDETQSLYHCDETDVYATKNETDEVSITFDHVVPSAGTGSRKVTIRLPWKLAKRLENKVHDACMPSKVVQKA